MDDQALPPVPDDPDDAEPNEPATTAPQPEAHGTESDKSATEAPTPYAETTEREPMSDDTNSDPTAEAPNEELPPTSPDLADQLPRPPQSPDPTIGPDPDEPEAAQLPPPPQSPDPTIGPDPDEPEADQLPPPPQSPDPNAQQLPPPPSSGQSQLPPRRLERSADRKIAGVAGGIAEYFNLDPVLIRLAFVIAMFAGGIGVIAYVIAWIVLPESDYPAPPRADRNFDTTTTIAVVLLAVAAVLAFADSFEGGFVLSLLLVGGGVYLLTQRESPADPAPLPPPPANASEHADQTARFAPISSTTAPEGRFSSPVSSTSAGTATMDRPAPPYRTPTGHTTDALPERHRREPAVVTRISLSLLALLFAGAIAGEQLGWFQTDVSTVAAIGLVGTGLALVVAAFVGRSRGLILVGIVLAVTFAASSVLEPITEDGVGQRSYTPASLSELEDEYKLGVGELRVDLRELEIPAGERVEVDVELGIGEARVLVPPLADLELTGDVGVGELELLGEVEDGIGNDLRVVRNLPGEGELVVNLDVGIGHGVVRRG